MDDRPMILEGRAVRVLSARTVVIGSGSAALNAADWLWDLNERDVLLMTEDMNTGTSRNAGSDKQTYYKLSLCASAPDSVAEMARSLHADGVHGDIAYAEAAGSAQSFLKLVQLGVEFPKNAYGEFVGYQTDHDRHRRASSAGPLTSRRMTEALERQIRLKGVPVLDGAMAFQLLLREKRVAGVLALDLLRNELIAVRCAHVILCTGGPAMLYRDSVYPVGHTGMSGMALEAGADGANLHHWQYGLASTAFRWNLSGSYQQALPRYISVDEQGIEREFLLESIKDPAECARLCFLKGYQWPFDVSKCDASSQIDLLVARERNERKRRVYLDYTRNPSGLALRPGAIDREVYEYLDQCGALKETPIERLAAINGPAIDLYRAHGIELSQTPLEISVCAQHQNGGIAVDFHWQSNVPGLYVAGEAAGTFGAYRPGGSALNSGQVGSLRAAEHIARYSEAELPADDPADWLAEALRTPLDALTMTDDPAAQAARWQQAMSECAAHLRRQSAMDALLAELTRWQQNHRAPLPDRLPADLPARLKLRDQNIAARAVLSAMLFAAARHGSTGAGFVCAEDKRDIAFPYPMKPPIAAAGSEVVRTHRENSLFASSAVPARPMPVADQWFERVWAEDRALRERKKGREE